MPNSRTAHFWIALFSVVGLPGCGDTPSLGQPAVKPLAATLTAPVDLPALHLQNVASFDVYLDRNRLHAVFLATATDTKTPYAAYLHSDDGGWHWSAPQAIAPSADRPIESKAGNDIQIAASGENLLAVWQATGELPGMGPLAAAYSTDGGQTWLAGAKPTGSDADQSHPDLLADTDGRFHAVWLDDREENGYQGLRYARSSDAGQHWELAQTIDDTSCSCCWNRLATGADGGINVLYRDMVPRDMALAQSADFGATWRRAGSVGAFGWQFDGCPHNGGGLALADDRSLHSVVWTGAENRVGLYHMQSNDNGASWTPPQRLGEGPAFHADIAAGSGRLVVVWDALGPEGSRVYFSESADSGRSWLPARQISPAAASFPRIVATPKGFLAMWLEQSPAGKVWSAAVLQ